MKYEKELEYLEKDNSYRVGSHVNIYENKADLLERISENADDPEETYNYMKEELDYLADDKKIYQIDTGNGMPNYYDDAKEAYDSM